MNRTLANPVRKRWRIEERFAFSADARESLIRWAFRIGFGLLVVLSLTALLRG